MVLESGAAAFAVDNAEATSSEVVAVTGRVILPLLKLLQVLLLFIQWLGVLTPDWQPIKSALLKDILKIRRKGGFRDKGVNFMGGPAFLHYFHLIVTLLLFYSILSSLNLF